ncbi:hypothetical protein X749_01820 [Mesorhizobium sp. LNJC391B00]|nr:hypothetical protein X749_01820 [Mesorhizobium sp. LNJC391B00]
MQLGSRKQRLVEMRAGRIARISNEVTMLQTMPCLSSWPGRLRASTWERTRLGRTFRNFPPATVYDGV